MPPRIDLTGHKYGHWTVLRFHGITNIGSASWECRCICGKEKVISRNNLRSGVSKSCGCNGGVTKPWKPATLPESKRCLECNEIKSISEFGFSAGRRTYKSKCRACTATIRPRKLLARAKRIKVRNQERRAMALRHYGSQCQCCSEKTPVFLAFDHINGGGNQHRGELSRRKFSNIADWLQRHDYPKDFQILCNNCNWAKHANELCPHQIDSAISALSFGS